MIVQHLCFVCSSNRCIINYDDDGGGNMSPPAKHKPEITPMNNHNFHSTVACAVCLLLVESDRLDYLHCFLYMLAL